VIFGRNALHKGIATQYRSPLKITLSSKPLLS
jgi:hypothetical protein